MAIEQLTPVSDRLSKYGDRVHLQDQDLEYMTGLLHEAFALGLDEAVKECREDCQWPPAHRLTEYGEGARDALQSLIVTLESRAKWARERAKV